jgi:hypothetical protein
MGSTHWVPVSAADPDPGSGAFLPPGSGIRDGAMVGSGSGIKHPQHWYRYRYCVLC